jgi:hypothetical protein
LEYRLFSKPDLRMLRWVISSEYCMGVYCKNTNITPKDKK